MYKKAEAFFYIISNVSDIVWSKNNYLINLLHKKYLYVGQDEIIWKIYSSENF